MLSVDIPGYGALRLAHLVLDFNGTLAVDGRLLPGARERLRRLAGELRVHVITADTFGKARAELKGLRCELVILGTRAQDRAKAAYVRRLGAAGTACIGNGRNDRLMLRVAALGIAVIQGEGAAPETVRAADVVVNDLLDGLGLLLNPLRLVATLRR
ncbi:MAG: ATPase P [Betaproteobacteria bacterium]|nr:MAG: ATPase P [Betaproteobacteria bacterium]